MQRQTRGILLIASVVGATALFTATASADTEVKLNGWLQQIAFSGDYRLRFDNEHFRTPALSGNTVNTGNTQQDDRTRFRMRLRLATDFTLPDNLKIRTRIDSGTGESVSPNQTFGNLNTEKGIWIGRAYLEWQTFDWLKLQGGKMANPLWTKYTSDAIFDGDVNPEGAAENLSHIFGGVNLFLNAMQMVASEIKNNVHDNYLYVEQVGGEVHLPLESRLKVAYAYYDWQDMNNAVATSANIAQSPIQEGNRRNAATGALLSKFGVSELTGELSTWIAKIPLSFQGTFLKNERAGIPANSAASLRPTEKKDTGYQAGLILGQAKDANSWEVAYFYKYLDTDATIADQADSDFGDGGTNRRGHIMWVAYNPTAWLTFQTKYFQTKNIDPTLTGSKGAMDRVQVDAVVKF